MKTLYLNRILCLGALIGVFSVSCKKKTEEVIKEIEKEVIVKDTTRPALRASFDYSRLEKAKIPYDSLFVDANGTKTVDYTEGNHLNLMYTDIAAYAATGNNGTTKLDSSFLKNKFANTNYPFLTLPPVGLSAVTYTTAQLNTSVFQLRNATGVSANQFSVWKTFQGFFSSIDVASLGINDTAKAGVAGRAYAKPNASGAVSRYLLDNQGVEMSQMIQKGLMGAFQYDYIANVLLSDASLGSAENHKLVAGKNYTELEHNWDVAFSLFTTNRVYGITATDGSSSGERYLGSYTREYGNSAFGSDFLKIHPAFLKGRAAIVNNDLVEAKAQATIIKTILEKVMARAGAEYIKKWSLNEDLAAGKHQLSEGLGFVYSLRFCKIHGADAAFSDDLLNELIYSNTNGVWGLVPSKAMATRDKIIQKFGL